MAKQYFKRGKIKAITTVVGDQRIEFIKDAEQFGLSETEALKMQKSLGLKTRHWVSRKSTTVDLSVEAVEKMVQRSSLRLDDVEAVIFVSQSPDYAAPASAIRIQHLLGLSESVIAYDIRLGCSGFVYGLSSAYGDCIGY